MKKIGWKRMIVLAGFLSAVLLLAGCGDGGKADYEKGVRYFKGDGVEKNPVEAVKLWQKAEKQGHLEAKKMLADANVKYALGVAYYNGTGVEKNLAEAVKLFRQAVEQGHAAAYYDLGRCYLLGEGVEKDEKGAMQLLRKAVTLGNVSAGDLFWPLQVQNVYFPAYSSSTTFGNALQARCSEVEWKALRTDKGTVVDVWAHWNDPTYQKKMQEKVKVIKSQFANNPMKDVLFPQMLQMAVGLRMLSAAVVNPGDWVHLQFAGEYNGKVRLVFGEYCDASRARKKLPACTAESLSRDMKEFCGVEGGMAAPDSFLLTSTAKNLNNDPEMHKLRDGFFVVDMREHTEVNNLFQAIYKGYPSVLDQEQ